MEIIKGYVTKRSCVEIQKFINHSLIGTTNLKIERIEKIVGRFNSDWEDEIKNLDHYQEYEASLNYIIGNRNIIAHGGNSGVTIRDLEANFEIIKDFISKIEDIYSVYT